VGRAAIHAGAEGRPELRGRFGLGGRQAFVGEAVVRMQPLEVRVSGSELQVTNLLDRALSDCRFADGFSVSVVGSLDPGESARAEMLEETLGPVFTCLLRGALPVPATEGRRAVEESGETFVALYRQPQVEDPDGEECCRGGSSPLAGVPDPPPQPARGVL
jgi:hypothetical protein